MPLVVIGTAHVPLVVMTSPQLNGTGGARPLPSGFAPRPRDAIRNRISGQLGGLAVGGSQVLGSAAEDVEVVVAEVAGAQPHRTVALVEQEAHTALGGVDRG